MSIETQKNFLGKTQTIIMAEVQSERWLSWVRLTIASFYTIICLFGMLIGQTEPISFLIQLLSIAFLVSYSCFYLFKYSKRYVQGYFVYVLIAFDIVVITLILWSYALSGTNAQFIASSLYGVYFITIAFTALHHKISLSLFCGSLSVIGYSILYLCFSPLHGNWANDYLLRVILLFAVAGLGGMISRNNARTIQQVVSSEIRYHNLVHRLPEMLFTIDLKGNFIWSNMASHAILGIPAKVLCERNIKNFLLNPEAFVFDKNGAKGTFEIKDFNGNRKFVDCIIQPSEDSENGAVYEGIMADVTDRELAISQREEMVNRLFQYQKMESLGTLASGMAHDFNNILQTISDVVSDISRNTKENDTQTKTKVVTESISDAKFLISELLALGRKKPLDYKAINLNKFLETIIPQYSQQIGTSYQVTLEMSDEPLSIQGDPDYLKRVFQNLFGNSRDAMPNGGTIVISCSFCKQEGESGSILIRFADNGPGIPVDYLEKIFDPFFTTKKPGKGTGLGLALVRRIMMLHHGNIEVEKTDSSGTIFKMEFPLSENSSDDIDTKTILMNRIPATILLLDDDPKIREVLKFFLKEFNYAVIEASNSTEALYQMKSAYDCKIVVMDWKVGNEDPHAIIHSMRELKNDLIIIVVSGYAPSNKSIKKLKIQRWFTKPYDKNQLDIEIQRSLRQKRSAQSTPASN